MIRHFFKKNSVFKTEIFNKLFIIPYITFLLLLLIIKLLSNDVDSLSWIDIIITAFVIFAFWLIISLFIIFIVKKVIIFRNKKKNNKNNSQVSKDLIKNDVMFNTFNENNNLNCIKTNDIKKNIEKTNNYNSEEKCLFVYDDFVDSNEYKKMILCFPKKIYWNIVKRHSIVNVIISFIILLISENRFYAIQFFCFYQIFILLVTRLSIGYLAERIFNKGLKKGKIENHILIEFYEDYLIRKTIDFEFNIKYNDFSKCLITSENIYLYSACKNTTLFIKRKNNRALCNFITKKFHDRIILKNS